MKLLWHKRYRGAEMMWKWKMHSLKSVLISPWPQLCKASHQKSDILTQIIHGSLPNGQQQQQATKKGEENMNQTKPDWIHSNWNLHRNFVCVFASASRNILWHNFRFSTNDNLQFLQMFLVSSVWFPHRKCKQHAQRRENQSHAEAKKLVIDSCENVLSRMQATMKRFQAKPPVWYMTIFQKTTKWFAPDKSISSAYTVQNETYLIALYVHTGECMSFHALQSDWMRDRFCVWVTNCVVIYKSSLSGCVCVFAREHIAVNRLHSCDAMRQQQCHGKKTTCTAKKNDWFNRSIFFFALLWAFRWGKKRANGLGAPTATTKKWIKLHEETMYSIACTDSKIGSHMNEKMRIKSK